MGRRGPPKKTAIENALNGNPGKRAINKQEPRYEAPDDLPCPDDITGAGRIEWERIGPVLVANGVLKAPDIVIFRNYCRIVSDIEKWEVAESKIPKTALSLKHRGYVANILSRLRTSLRHYAQDCGITPASRSAVKAIPKRKNEPQDTSETASPEKKQTQAAGNAQGPSGNVARFFKRG